MSVHRFQSALQFDQRSAYGPKPIGKRFCVACDGLEPPGKPREMTLLASRNAHPADFTRIIKLIEDGKIDTAPWITHHAQFDEMIDVFPSWLRPESGVIKAVVTVA